MNNHFFFSLARVWLPLALSMSALFFTLYVVLQQSARLGANDPQVQMVEDGARALERGASPELVASVSKVDIAESDALFVEVFDEQGNLRTTSATLHGSPLSLPLGVLTSSFKGQHRVTWQPEQGIREALVIQHYGGAQSGFVVAGRSLHETEKHIDIYGLLIGVAWLITLFSSLILVIVFQVLEGGWLQKRTGNS